ncbi:MAG: cupin domain-containing protein [Anaerolineales bacterium]|nr:cupin domain-containing protein [Anaerolineales bacterium]
MSNVQESRHEMTINYKPFGYLRRPNDAMAHIESEKGTTKMLVAPWELDNHCEVWDISWIKGATVSYHKHLKAHETFLVANGSIAFTLEDKRFVMRPGDMVHITPHMAHGLECLEDGTRVLSFFHNVGNFVYQQDESNLRKYSPELLEDAAFMSEFRARHGFIDADVPLVIDVENGVPNLRRLDEGVHNHQTKNGNHYLKVAPWETNNVYEAWEDHMLKVVEIEGHLHRYGWEVFIIITGRAELTIGEIKHIALPGDVLVVPPFAPHQMYALDDDGFTMLMFMQNYEFYRKRQKERVLEANEPEKYNDPDYFWAFHARHDSHEYNF